MPIRPKTSGGWPGRPAFRSSRKLPALPIYAGRACNNVPAGRLWPFSILRIGLDQPGPVPYPNSYPIPNPSGSSRGCRAAPERVLMAFSQKNLGGPEASLDEYNQRPAGICFAGPAFRSSRPEGVLHGSRRACSTLYIKHITVAYAGHETSEFRRESQD